MNSLIKKSSIMAVMLGSTLSFLSSLGGVAMPPQPKNGQQPQLSQEDVKLLEEVEQQINSYVASLPPDEQKKFWSDVDELTKVMSTMSEDELVKFMEDVFTEEAAQQKQPVAEAPVAAPAKKIEIEEKPVLPADKQLQAINLIDSLIKHIGNFLRKAQTMVDLPAKVISWTKEGKLKNWPTSLTWDVFKGYIDELNQKLNKLKDKDPKTNKYKYLDDFIKDEALYNNLSKVSTSLSKNEPLLEVSSFGIDKMTTQSREATRSVLMSLQEAYSVLGIPAALDKIFEKYEPTAKKLKEAEEVSQKQALEASKRPTTRAPMVVGGTPREREYRKEGGYPEYRGGDRYTPSYDYYDKRPEREEGTEKKKIEGPTPTGGKEAGKEGAKETGKPGEKGAEKPKEEKEQKAIEGAIAAFEQELETFLDVVETNKNLQGFNDYMKEDKPLDESVGESIKAARKAINNASNQISRIKRRLPSEKITPSQRKEFLTLVKQAYRESKTWLDRISTEIESAKKSLDYIGVMKAPQYGPLKKYAYFGVGKKEDLLAKPGITDEQKKQIEAIKPMNIGDLSDAIKDLYKDINELK